MLAAITTKGEIMKKWLYTLAFLLLAAGCSTAPVADNSHTGSARLRYDGLYRSAEKQGGAGGYWYYLRFYPDGVVMAVSTGLESESAQQWLNPDSQGPGIGRGQFTVTGNRVTFSSTSQVGVVDYDGEFRGDVVHFETLSHINGYRGSRDFVFVPLSGAQGAAPK